MKQRVFMVLLTCVLIFALSGCGTAADENKPASGSLLGFEILSVRSHEELAQAKRNADLERDVNDLKNLNYYYIPAYAESRYELTGFLVTDGLVAPMYNSNDFSLTFYRRPYGNEYLAAAINPSNYANGNAPKPFGVEDIYYKEVVNIYGDMVIDATTNFHFVHDGYYIFVRIDQKLMDEIREKDPDALKGPLFGLRKIELK